MEERKGSIANEGLLDLTWAKTADDLKGITSITNVGAVKVPEELMGAFSAIPRSNVGAVFSVKPGNWKTLTGPMRVSGDMLAGGDPETMLMVTGQLLVTPPLASIGYKEISVMGQLILPRGSEAVIAGKLGTVMGQLCYYNADKGEPRQFSFNETVGRELLEMLEPTTWIVMGNLTIEDDVTPELMRAKVPEIVLIGNIDAPRSLKTVLQLLTSLKMGEISIRDEKAPEEG